jgi:3-oxoacid CoA-transferase subunit B
VVDMVVTDLGVFSIDRNGKEPMRLLELAPGVTLDEITSKTEADFVSAL